MRASDLVAMVDPVLYHHASARDAAHQLAEALSKGRRAPVDVVESAMLMDGQIIAFERFPRREWPSEMLAPDLRSA